MENLILYFLDRGLEVSGFFLIHKNSSSKWEEILPDQARNLVDWKVTKDFHLFQLVEKYANKTSGPYAIFIENGVIEQIIAVNDYPLDEI